MPISKELIDILACPKCHGKLEYRLHDPEAFDCHSCGLRYAVENGIPNFIIEKAKKIAETTEK